MPLQAAERIKIEAILESIKDELIVVNILLAICLIDCQKFEKTTKSEESDHEKTHFSSLGRYDSRYYIYVDFAQDWEDIRIWLNDEKRYIDLKTMGVNIESLL